MTIKRVKLDTLSDKQTVDARAQAAAILQAHHRWVCIGKV